MRLRLLFAFLAPTLWVARSVVNHNSAYEALGSAPVPSLQRQAIVTNGDVRFRAGFEGKWLATSLTFHLKYRSEMEVYWEDAHHEWMAFCSQTSGWFEGKASHFFGQQPDLMVRFRRVGPILVFNFRSITSLLWGADIVAHREEFTLVGRWFASKTISFVVNDRHNETLELCYEDFCGTLGVSNVSQGDVLEAKLRTAPSISATLCTIQIEFVTDPCSMSGAECTFHGDCDVQLTRTSCGPKDCDLFQQGSLSCERFPYLGSDLRIVSCTLHQWVPHRCGSKGDLDCLWHSVCYSLGQRLDCDHGRVTTISLPHENLSGEIPDDLTLLDCLVHLDLRQNDLSGPCPFAKISSRMAALRTLDLSHNKLTGLVDFSDKFSGPKARLEIIDLSYNMLQKPEILSLQFFDRLRAFHARWNNFAGPATIYGTGNIKYISLAHNQLEGYLSYFCWYYTRTVPCDRIIEIDVRDNSIGKIDTEVFRAVPILRLSDNPWLNLTHNLVNPEGEPVLLPDKRMLPLTHASAAFECYGLDRARHHAEGIVDIDAATVLKAAPQQCRCRKGFQGLATDCQACEAGYSAEWKWDRGNHGEWSCGPCALGKFKPATSDPEDAKSQICSPCPGDALTTFSVGSSSEEDCVCKRGFMAATFDGDRTCEPCSDLLLKCDRKNVTLETAETHAGTWRGGQASRVVVPCRNPDACQGGRFDGQCKKGYVGRKCAECAPGFFLVQPFVCAKCRELDIHAKVSWGVLSSVLLIVAIVVGGVCGSKLIAHIRRPSQPPGEFSGLPRLVMPKVLVIFLICQLYGLFGKLGTTAQTLMPVVFKWCVLDSSVFTHIFRLDCLLTFRTSQMLQLVLNPLWPFLVIIISLIAVIIAKGGLPVEAMRWQIQIASVVISATWAGAIASVAQLFLCDNDFENNESYLVALGYQEQCSVHNPTFRVLRAFGVVIGMFWTIGLPALIQMILRRWRDRVRPAVHEITSVVQFFVEDAHTLTCQCTVVDLCKRAGDAALEDAVGASCAVYTAWLEAYLASHGGRAASLQRASGGQDCVILRLSLGGPTAPELARELADAAAADAERLLALQTSLRVRLLLRRWQREGREPVLCGLGFLQKYDPTFVSFELMLKIMTTAFGYIAAVTGTLNQALVGMGTCVTALMLLVNMSPHIDRSNDRLLAACFSSLLVACLLLSMSTLNMVDKIVLSYCMRPTLAFPVVLLVWDVAMMLLPEQRRKSLIFLFELESKRLEYLHGRDDSDGISLATEAYTAELIVASGVVASGRGA